MFETQNLPAMDTTVELEKEIEALRKELRGLREEMNAITESPYLQSSVKNLVYEVLLDREEIVEREFGHRINEKHGTMFEIKQQARRLALLLGLDGDMVRMMVTEALQNIIEHGYGRYVTVRFEIENDDLNPSLVSSFKHELPPGKKYTLSDINRNALRGDVTSEYFDFESDRGRGEYIMKQLTDERRIVNGIEIDKDGRKVHYFKRILINYKNPSGGKHKISFSELKAEIDRLNYEDVVCCFHMHHVHDMPDAVTIATTKHHAEKVAHIMSRNFFKLKEQEPYYRTVFATYMPTQPVDRDQLLSLFASVRQEVYEESARRET